MKISKAKSLNDPWPSGLQRYLVCYIWSSSVFFHRHRKMSFNYLLKAIQIFSFDDYLTMEPLSKPLRMNDTTQYITQPLRTETIFVKVITKAASLHLGLKFCCPAKFLWVSQFSKSTRLKGFQHSYLHELKVQKSSDAIEKTSWLQLESWKNLAFFFQKPWGLFGCLWTAKALKLSSM